MRLFAKSAVAAACGAGLLFAASGDRAQTAGSAAPPPVSAAAQAAPPEPAHAAVRAPAPRPAAPEAAAAPAQPGARLAPGTPIPPAELEALVDGVVREAMAQDHIAGVAVAVVQDGQVALKKGYGFSGPDRPVDPDATLFRLGSISKTFTWIALMKEAEAGRIRLNTPVNLYLPEALQVKDQGFSRPILVRDLMTHTPGFADRLLGAAFEKNPDRIRPMAEFLRQERPARVREPGVLPTYSNYGAALAGEAVSWVESRPYQDIVEAEITGPLGMRHTTLREPYPPRADLPAPMPAALAGAVSRGYRWDDGRFEPQAFEYVTQAAPAGAVSSTAGDMARYMMMILNGGSLEGAAIYDAETAKGFRTPLLAAAPGVNGVDDGFLEFSLPGGFHGQGHDGDTLWFHANMVTIPALNLGVFVATNTDTGGALAADLPDRIVGRFYAAPSELPRPGSPELAGQAAIYDGSYLTNRRPYAGLSKFVFLLIGQMRAHVTGDGRLIIDGGEGDGAWVPNGAEGQFIQANGPETSAFRIENGRADRWYAASGVVAYDRVGPLLKRRTLALITALAARASIATLVGLFTRDRREFRQTPTQARAGQIQTAIAVLWLVAMGAFAGFQVQAMNFADIIYGWPGPFVLIGSACALVAAVLTAVTVVMAPAVWRGGRRVDSWTGWRKLRFTLSTLVFAAFSLLLGYWGALEPWSR